MPQVEIQSVDVTPLDNKLVQVSATIVNRKLTPTHADIDLQNRITPPDIATISGRGLKVIAGLQSDEPQFLNATEQQHRPGEIRIPNIPGKSAVHVRWFVQGTGPYTVQIQSAKGGFDQKKGS